MSATGGRKKVFLRTVTDAILKKRRESMLEFSHTFDKKTFEFNLPRARQRFLKGMSASFRQGVWLWAKTIIQSGVPVETGMAKEALRPISEIKGLKRLAGLNYTPTRKPYKHALYEGQLHGPELGRELSSVEFVDDQDGIYIFEWNMEVIHFWWSEYYQSKTFKSGEIAIAKADAVFEEYITRRLDTLGGDILRGN